MTFLETQTQLLACQRKLSHYGGGMTNFRSLNAVRYLLTVENKINRYLRTGPLEPGTPVTCLRRDRYGHYMPCVAYIAKVHKSKRVTVDLWKDKSERTTVSEKAILWLPEQRGEEELLRELVADEKAQKTPIVIVSKGELLNNGQAPEAIR